MKVSGQPHASAALASGKDPSIPRACLDAVKTGMEPQLSSLPPAIILTELPWLSFMVCRVHVCVMLYLTKGPSYTMEGLTIPLVFAIGIHDIMSKRFCASSDQSLLYQFQ